jgi:internalin A
MTDLEIIKQIEKELNIKLSRISLKNGLNTGYELNESREIVSICIGNCSLNDFDKILSFLLEFKALNKLILRKIQPVDFSKINRLNRITELDLSENEIVDISFLKEMSQLTHLTISRNNITNIASIEFLNKLIFLDLNQNSIDDVSPLKDLKKILKLNLSNNKLEDIRPLANLININKLYLHDNFINDIEILKGFKNLEGLYCVRNMIHDITCLGNLFNLKDIFAGNNEIEDISPLRNVKSLIRLYLPNNMINDISSLKDLKRLKHLVLTKNPITEIPEWITDLNVKIKWSKYDNSSDSEVIIFFDNPIDSPPIEIIKEGNDAIKRYFEKINQEGKDYIYEAKLTFVGEGSAGKTSLQKRLMKNSSDLPAKDTRTRGIEITDWEFQNIDGKKHVAHIWDFGGQDVYYPVHRFFITENSVFVLLASTRQNHHNFDYWIPTIYQFGGKSPIILGQTCHDGNKFSWNDLGVYLSNSNFNIIKTLETPYYELNLPNNNEGLSQIKHVISNQILNLPRYGRGVPKSWVIVRFLLAEEAKETACISFEKYKVICLAASQVSFNKLSDFTDCCRFLHDIGVVLWYSAIDELKNWVILQPEWAMNAVYKIIDDSEIQTRRGNIIDEDFTRLWNENFYDDKHSILKSMLEVFKIAFPKKHIKGDYIIPARLLSMPNEKKWTNERCLRLEYRYEFMPRGLVNQVSAELSRYIVSDDEVWNNAVNFSTVNNIAQCQVEEDFYNRTIIIKAKGRDARSLIILVMNALMNITEGYKGVRPEIYVPCTCSKCKDIEGSTTFLYDKLLNWSTNDPGRRVICNESGDSLTIESLLYNVGLSNPSFPIEKKKVFISYSRKDVEYKNELKKHLKILQTFNIVDNWSCEEITIGKWNDQIQTALEESDLIIYMLSANFFTSKYILDNEVQKGMQWISNDENKQILCVIVSDFVGLDKLKDAVKDSDTNSLQDSLLQLADYQYLPYANVINSVTGNNEEKIIPLKVHPDIDHALKQITEKVLTFYK